MLLKSLCQIDWRSVYEGQLAICYCRTNSARDRGKHKEKSLHGLKIGGALSPEGERVRNNSAEHLLSFGNGEEKTLFLLPGADWSKM